MLFQQYCSFYWEWIRSSYVIFRRMFFPSTCIPKSTTHLKPGLLCLEWWFKLSLRIHFQLFAEVFERNTQGTPDCRTSQKPPTVPWSESADDPSWCSLQIHRRYVRRNFSRNPSKKSSYFYPRGNTAQWNIRGLIPPQSPHRNFHPAFTFLPMARCHCIILLMLHIDIIVVILRDLHLGLASRRPRARLLFILSKSCICDFTVVGCFCAPLLRNSFPAVCDILRDSK